MNPGLLHQRRTRKRGAQSGYIMIMILLMLALMVLAMTVAAPKIAQQVKREREEEMIHRGTEYARAVKKYFHKFNRYPTSIEQLENTNNIRFLRKRYTDPMNPEGVWRIVRVGEVQLAQPINGASPAGGAPTSPGTMGGPGIASTGGATSNSGGSSFGFGNPPAMTQGQQAPSDEGGDAGTGQTGGTPSAFGNPGGALGGGAMMGVASLSKAKGIHEFNNKSEYSQWFFVYVQAQDRGLLRGPYNPKAVFGNSGGIQGAKDPSQLNQPSQQQLQQQSLPPGAAPNR